MFIELYNQISISEDFNSEGLISTAKDNIFDVVKKFSAKNG